MDWFMQYLKIIMTIMLVYIVVLLNDNIKSKRKVKILQDSIVVIQKDLEFKCKITKDQIKQIVDYINK